MIMMSKSKVKEARETVFMKHVFDKGGRNQLSQSAVQIYVEHCGGGE